MSVGQRIAQKRKEIGLSQEVLGEQLGVSRQAIYKWESDATLPEIEKLIALSRIFSVSVGWLLGTEEEPADGEPADSGELSERQLQMVREIVDGYLAARPAPELPKRRRWPRVLGSAACIALIVVLVNLFNRLDSLNSQYDNLQYSVSNIQSNVSSQLGSLTGRVEEILKSQNDLTADYSTENIGVNPAENTAAFSFRVVPRTCQEGMRAWIDVESQGQRFTCGPYEAQDDIFSGTFTAALSDQISVYIVFELDGVRQTQLLDTWYNLYSGSFPDLWLDAWPLIFAVDEKTDALDDALTAYFILYDDDGNLSTLEGAGITSYRVGLFADQELVAWFAPDTRIVYSDGQPSAEDIYTLDQAGLALDRSRVYCIAAVLVDRYGREYIMQDTPMYYRDGDGWTNVGNYSSGPCSTDGWVY